MCVCVWGFFFFFLSVFLSFLFFLSSIFFSFSSFFLFVCLVSSLDDQFCYVMSIILLLHCRSNISTLVVVMVAVAVVEVVVVVVDVMCVCVCVCVCARARVYVWGGWVGGCMGGWLEWMCV